MTLQAVVDSLEAVPEAQRELYTEQDGKWRLDLEGAHFPEEVEEKVRGLKTKSAELLREKKALAKLVEGVPDDLKEQLEELATLRTDAETRANAKAEEKGEWDKLKGQLQDGHQKEKDTWDAERASLVGELDQSLRKDKVTAALLDGEAHVKIMLPHVMGSTRTIKEDGKHKVVVVDEEDERRLGKDGEDMTIDELVAEMSEDADFAYGFEGSDATGGGATGRRVAGGDKRKALKDMTEAEKIAFTEEHGLEEYNKLVMEAYGQE